MFRLLVVALFSCLVPLAHAEPLQVTFGGEYFSWREYDQNRRLLEETGPRYFVSLKTGQPTQGSWRYDLAGRVYLGQADYDGHTQVGTPYATDTDYLGWAAELGVTRMLGVTDNLSGWGIRLGLGYDAWRRRVQDGYDLLGKRTYGHDEDYRIGYGRLGAVYGLGDGWQLQGGLKLPFYAHEHAELSRLSYDGDTTLKPKPDYSLYASLSYRLNGRWDVGGYYDSYRFRESGQRTVNRAGNPYSVYQPKSQQDTLGFYLNYRF